MRKIYFSVNDFDRDGDISDQGIYLHFGETRVKVADDLKEYGSFVDTVERMESEIAEVFDT